MRHALGGKVVWWRDDDRRRIFATRLLVCSMLRQYGGGGGGNGVGSRLDTAMKNYYSRKCFVLWARSDSTLLVLRCKPPEQASGGRACGGFKTRGRDIAVFRRM